MTARRTILVLAVAGLALGLALFVWHDASLIAWLARQQRQWHRQLAAGLNALAGERSQTAAMALVGVSLLYGIFHAAGPGHGKAAIATWLLTHPSRLARGVAMAVAAALLQGLVAVSVVGSVLLLADWLPVLSNDLVVGWSERVAFGLLIGVGASTLWRGASAGRRHRHGPGCQCRHGPEAGQIARAQNWRGMAGIVLAVGARPCSGAILILALAKTLNLTWAGAMAVLAMSLGTALTTALLAVLTVKSRAWVAGLFAHGERHDRSSRAIRMIGGGILVLLGVSLLFASFNVPHPLRL